MAFAAACLKLLNKRENIPVVFTQELAEMRHAFRMDLLPYDDSAATREVFVELIVQLHPVGHEHKAPIAGNLSQYLLREENHRHAFPGALRMPKHAQLSLIRFNLPQGSDGVVRAQVLVILGDKLDESALRLHEEREVFDEVEQAFMIAQSPEHGLQRTRALFLLGTDAFPFGEVLPTGGDPAEPALRAVGDDNQRIVPEQVGNGVFVVAEIAAVGGVDGFVNPFELHQQEG